jgi:hypothetical protein
MNVDGQRRRLIAVGSPEVEHLILVVAVCHVAKRWHRFALGETLARQADHRQE